MRLRLPSELPAELEKSLSSCRRQRDALWQALKEFRGVLGGMLFFWEGSRGIFGELGGIWGGILLFWDLGVLWENSKAFQEEKIVQGKATAPRSPSPSPSRDGATRNKARKGEMSQRRRKG